MPVSLERSSPSEPEKNNDSSPSPELQPGSSIDEVVAELHSAHATLPSGADAATTIAEEVDKLSKEISDNWKYVDGQLEPSVHAKYTHRLRAGDTIRTPEKLDIDAARIVAHTVDELRDEGLETNKSHQTAIDELDELIKEHGPLPHLKQAKDSIRLLMDHEIDSDYLLRKHPKPGNALADEFLDQEKEVLEAEITKRIEDDKLPWTTHCQELSPDVLEWLKRVYENITVSEDEPSPNDQFTIRRPVRRVDGETGFDPKDVALAELAGVDIGVGLIRRGELQRAGVFFINRLGDGEQPIFGVPIPDEDSEGGVFNVQDRSLLTKAEFEKVYKYQQEHGYGAGEHDIKDVQMDMLVFAMRPEGRISGTKKYASFSSREDKYAPARSPFVDSGIDIRSGVEPLIFNKEIGTRRMNTMSIHLANAHPDYPGLSEMFTDSAATDQRYMSVGEFVENYYMPPPSREDILFSLQQDIPAPRERAWVGKFPENY